jgi:hypothetical protein
MANLNQEKLRIAVMNLKIDDIASDWLEGKLPSLTESWPRKNKLWIGPDNDQDDFSHSAVKKYTRKRMWVWSGRTVYFFCDIHADANAFFLSLVASGGVIKTGPNDEDFELTEEGKTARFIIGGDCFDKGPNNLRLLEVMHNLYSKDADLILLAGNHDIRTYLGIFYAESKDPLLDHLFVRMGEKTVPLLKEIFQQFIEGNNYKKNEQNDQVMHDLLFPNDDWYDNFSNVAKKWIRPEKLTKELKRIKEKTIEFEQRAQDFGLELNDVYAAVKKFRELFFEPSGRYFWFFNKMQIAHREGSYLFVHGGVDDTVAEMINQKGIDSLNSAFRQVLREDPFELYHGVIGNIFRTKYRTFDYKFTKQGVKKLHHAGIYAIAHGHRNVLQGQRVLIRAGMLNFECDASVDCNTRSIEGIYGPGGATVRFDRKGYVDGISTDYPYVKRFHPGFITVVGAPFSSNDFKNI